MGACKIVAVSFACGVCFVSPVSGEIYQCNGKWTNRPCDGAIEKTLPERVSDDLVEQSETNKSAESSVDVQADKKSSAVLEPLAPRYALTHKLRKFNRDFSLKHKISLSKSELHAYEQRCLNRENPLADCQQEYDALVQRLNTQLKKP